MSSNADRRRAAPAPRKNPYDERPGRGRTLVMWLRLGLLFMAVTACVTAAFVLRGWWQDTQGAARIRLEGGSPDLSVSERLYLESYLAARTEQLAAPAGAAGDLVPFTIAAGESANQIAANLSAAGLVSDPVLFVNYVRYYGLDSALVGGNFLLEPQITIPELAATLSNPYQDITLNFLRGWRLEEMTRYLAATRPGSIDADDFLAIAQRRQQFDLSPYDFLANHPAGASLEGYLYPDSYRVTVDETAADLVAQMLANFGRQVTPAMRQAYGVNGLTVREAVTLASIVEREAPLDEERARIAGVFLNRLAQSMPLQADSTVQYALGYDAASSDWWKTPLLLSDLQVDSTYNTYIYAGLPPGPIANPGLASLTAVAYPEESDFLFFVADCTDPGRHLFSVTYDEHLVNVARCRP